MSSHHFVKEGQEPALIIANGQSCSHALLNQLIEWCPFIVVLDGAYNRVQKLEIKPDVVIGDFDSIELINNDIDVEFIKIHDQSTTDLEKGITYLKDKGYKNINVVWATGKRLDHTLNNISILAKYSEISIVFYDDFSKAFLVPKSFSKRYKMNTAISLVPLGTVSGISSSNLKFELDNTTLSFGTNSGTSNSVLENGVIHIKYRSGNLVLIESRDGV